jgi:1,2-phenylacetyl-CoA epoxidase PaaB subunit
MSAPQNTVPVYEVFTQTGPSAPVTHAGSIVCHQPQQAWHLAKEAFGRRDDLVQLWVVPRDSVITSAEPYDPAVLAAKTRMPHRQPAFPLARRKRREQAGEDATAVAGGSVPATLWRCLADDLFLHAHRLADRIVDYIELEASLAVGSIAQEDLAHARTAVVLCGLEPAAVDGHFFDRDQQDWFPSRMLLHADESWLATIARGLILSAAATTAAGATLDRASAGGSTIEVEQRVHFEHWSNMAAGVLADEDLMPEFADVFAVLHAAAADLFHAPSGVVGSDGISGDPIPEKRLAAGFAELLGTAVPAHWLIDRGGAVPRSAGGALATTLDQLRSVRSAYGPGVFA